MFFENHNKIAAGTETFPTMVEDVVTDTGRIDVLINNFGTSNPGKDLDFSNTDPQVFLDTVNLNLRSIFMATPVYGDLANKDSKR